MNVALCYRVLLDDCVLYVLGQRASKLTLYATISTSVTVQAVYLMHMVTSNYVYADELTVLLYAICVRVLTVLPRGKKL
jgi:hypothetical protein